MRLRATLPEAREVEGGVHVAFDCTVEIEGGDRPACVARTIHRYLA